MERGLPETSGGVNEYAKGKGSQVRPSSLRPTGDE